MLEPPGLLPKGMFPRPWRVGVPLYVFPDMVSFCGVGFELELEMRQQGGDVEKLPRSVTMAPIPPDVAGRENPRQEVKVLVLKEAA